MGSIHDPEILAAVALLREAGWKVFPPGETPPPREEPMRPRTAAKPGAAKGMTSEELGELLTLSESCGRLSDFEEEFLGSLRERYAKYNGDVRISPKQAAVLARIQEKI